MAGQSQEAREEEAREEEDREEDDREEEDREEEDWREEDWEAGTIANTPPPDSQLAEVEDLVAAAQNARSVYSGLFQSIYPVSSPMTTVSPRYVPGRVSPAVTLAPPPWTPSSPRPSA